MSRRILIVDDDGATVERLDAALRRVGLDPRALTGALGLDRHLQRHPPAAILLAADLPDAENALRQITGTPSVQGVPLLFYGYGRPDDLVRSPSEALARGGDYFFKLPTDYDYLAGRVQGWLRVPESSFEPAENAGPAGPLDLEAFASTRPEAHPATDVIRTRQDLASEDPRTWAWAEHLDEDDGPEPPEPEAEEAPAAEAPPAERSPSTAPAGSTAPPDLAAGTASSGGRALVVDAAELERSGQRADAVEAYATAATLFQMDGELDRAIRTYRYALSLDPLRSDLAEATADLLLSEGRPGEAVALLNTSAQTLQAGGDRAGAQRLRDRRLGINTPSDPSVPDDLAKTDDRSLTPDLQVPPSGGPGERAPPPGSRGIPPAATTDIEVPPSPESPDGGDRWMSWFDAEDIPIESLSDPLALDPESLDTRDLAPPLDADADSEPVPDRAPDSEPDAAPDGEAAWPDAEPEELGSQDLEPEEPEGDHAAVKTPSPETRADRSADLPAVDEPLFDGVITTPPGDVEGPDEPAPEPALEPALEPPALEPPADPRADPPRARAAGGPLEAPEPPLAAGASVATDPTLPRPVVSRHRESRIPEDADESSDDLLDAALDAALRRLPAPTESSWDDGDGAAAAYATDADLPPATERLPGAEADAEAPKDRPAADEAEDRETARAEDAEARDAGPAEERAREDEAGRGPEAAAPEAPTSSRNPFFDDVEYAESRDLGARASRAETAAPEGSEPADPREPERPTRPTAGPEAAFAPATREDLAPGLALGASSRPTAAPKSAASPPRPAAFQRPKPPEASESAPPSASTSLPPEAFGLPPIPETAGPGAPEAEGALPFDAWLEASSARPPPAGDPWTDPPELESAPPLEAPLPAGSLTPEATYEGAAFEDADGSSFPAEEDAWGPARRRPGAVDRAAATTRSAGRLAFRGLEPARGRIEHPADAVDLLIALDREGCTGVLEADGVSPIVFAAGQARDLRGPEAVEAALWGWTAPRDAAEPQAATEGAEGLRRALRRHARGFGLSPQACDLAAAQALSQAMVQLLLLEGEWRFMRPEPPLRAEELLPPGLDTQESLVGWVAQALPTEELLAAIGGADVRLKVSARAPVPRQADLRRLFRALDGRQSFDAARRQAHVAPARAAAQAAVWVWAGWTGPTRPPEPAPAPASAPWAPYGWMPWFPWGPPPWTGAPAPPPAGPMVASPAGLGLAPAHPAPPAAAAEAEVFGGRAPHPEAEGLEPSARIRHLADLARHADYFRILDVPRDAGPEAVAAAHAVLVRRLTTAARDADPSLAPVVRELLRTLDEAREVLSVPEMREAYREHRGP